MNRAGRVVAIAALAGIVLVAAIFCLRPARAGARPAGHSATGGTLRVRVWEPGGVTPTVSVNVPVVVVSAAIRLAAATGVLDRAMTSACDNLPDPSCPRLRGADIVAIWGQIASGRPVSMVDVDDGAGGRVEIKID
ncbi:MAG TPA: hypothetical protein VFB49_07010 [Patescibacteria group bacterium]|nr:hypothetical protein [Patescibacteria group bacterium]